MWWNGRFASWMCSRQICRNCVMLSCQYGPKSLRNVSNTLLSLCHEELRQFWRQKGVQPGTSKVYLITCPVSECVYLSLSIYIYIYIERERERIWLISKTLKHIRIFILNMYLIMYQHLTKTSWNNIEYLTVKKILGIFYALGIYCLRFEDFVNSFFFYHKNV